MRSGPIPAERIDGKVIAAFVREMELNRLGLKEEDFKDDTSREVR